MAEGLAELPDDTGRYLVTTEASCYLIDLADGTLTRVPDAGLGAADGATVVPAALRGDHLPLRLVERHQVCVGEPPVFIVDVRNDGVLTFRVGTPVRRIERVGPANPNV